MVLFCIYIAIYKSPKGMITNNELLYCLYGTGCSKDTISQNTLIVYSKRQDHVIQHKQQEGCCWCTWITIITFFIISHEWEHLSNNVKPKKYFNLDWIMFFTLLWSSICPQKCEILKCEWPEDYYLGWTQTILFNQQVFARVILKVINHKN